MHDESWFDTLNILSGAKSAVIAELLDHSRHRERWLRGEVELDARQVTGRSFIDLLEAYRTAANAWEIVLKG